MGPWLLVIGLPILYDLILYDLILYDLILYNLNARASFFKC